MIIVDRRVFLPFNHSYMGIRVRFINYQYLCEWLFILVLGINQVDLYHLFCLISYLKNDILLENFSYSCSWMRRKIIEVELHHMWTLKIIVHSHIYLHSLCEVHGITEKMWWYHVVYIPIHVYCHYLYYMCDIYTVTQIIGISIISLACSVQRWLLIIFHHNTQYSRNLRKWTPPKSTHPRLDWDLGGCAGLNFLILFVNQSVFGTHLNTSD